MSFSKISKPQLGKKTPIQQRTQPKSSGAKRQINTWTQFGAMPRRLSKTSSSAVSPIIQAKLKIGQPNDKYEQEADRVANAVMANSNHPVDPISQRVQSKIYRAELRSEDMVDSMPSFGGEFGDKSLETSQTEEVQRSESGETGTISPSFEQSLQQATHGGGKDLPSSIQNLMENRFGYNFSSVRIHNDARAHTLAQQVNARAFTLDQDIFFARSQYQPDSHEGQHLLAHELTHVVQQSEGRLSRQIQRQTSCNSYNGYDNSVDLMNYNCAGLATRTYQFIAPASAAIDSIVANFLTPHTPISGGCGPAAVKFWLWEYDLHLEDDQGTVLAPPNSDFHIVAGMTDLTGADPTNVYSKNGRRRVYGPGSGSSFRPAARSRALSNNPQETPVTFQGRPVFKVRSNMTEAITCAECH